LLVLTLSLLYILSAFGLGAAHALEPGHGKTLVATYLAGTKGRWIDAVLIGLVVMISHTASVFLVAMAGLFMAYSLFKGQQQILTALQVLSGLIILSIGIMLFYRRFVVDKTPDECECHIPHVHHAHAPLLQASNGQTANAPTVPCVSNTKDLLGLGIASGITPCPSAIAAVFASFSLGGKHPVLQAFLFLVIFSFGLASVLTGVGLVLIGAKNRLTPLLSGNNKTFSVYITRFSTALMIGLGLYLTLKPLLWPGVLPD
jgi:nickel/cobalt transporter (NicO) family protein